MARFYLSSGYLLGRARGPELRAPEVLGVPGGTLAGVGVLEVAGGAIDPMEPSPGVGVGEERHRTETSGY